MGPTTGSDSSAASQFREAPLSLPPEAFDLESERTLAPSGIYMADPQAAFPQISGYRIVRELGAGGMGRVYEACEQQSGRSVALKVLACPRAQKDPEAVDRFVREGRLAAKISHPRSTFVYEAGFDNEQPFIAMELMPGKTLQDELREHGKLTVQRTVDVTLDIIEGLSAAHNLGVIHRDVKPSNCFVGSDGRMKIGDFGLSKSLVIDTNLTRTGTFMGTPSFSSPEQVRGEDVDIRSDIYSLGATMFNLLAGRPPFVGDAMSVTAQIIANEPPSLRKLNPQVPKGLDQIIQQTLAKDPNGRFPDLEALRSALLPYATHGATLAQVGRRVAAFMFDYAGINAVHYSIVFLTTLVFMAFRGVGDGTAVAQQQAAFLDFLPNFQFWAGIANWLMTWLYFAILESVLGWTPGKNLMGLRVVNQWGERPSWARSLYRSWLIPGALGIPLLATVIERYGLHPDDRMSMEWVLLSYVLSILPLVLIALCFLLTMRKTGGLEGFHDYLSRTRVIHLNSQRRGEIRFNQQLPFEALSDRFTIGRFQVMGRLSTPDSGSTTLLAWDELLDRKVLIFLENLSATDEVSCLQVNRATRNRWLQGGIWEGQRWNAFEYFGGIPFSFLTHRSQKIEWEDLKGAIFDWVREMVAATQDGTLPANLSFDHLMVNEYGRGRVMSLPLNVIGNRWNSGSSSPVGKTTLSAQSEPATAANGRDRASQFPVDSSTTSSAVREACQVARDILEWCLNHMALSPSTETFINQYRNLPATPETLIWLQDHMDSENRRSSRMTWDARVGVFAVTAGGEWSIYGALTMFISWLISRQWGYFPLMKYIPVILVLVTGLWIIGWLTRGGPVFRILGVEVRRRDGGPAANWQLGARMALSWLGLVTVTVFTPLLMDIGSHEIQKQKRLSQVAALHATMGRPSATAGGEGIMAEDNAEKSATELAMNSQAQAPVAAADDSPAMAGDAAVDPLLMEIEENPISFLVIFAMICLGLVAMVGGALFALLSPARGLVDFVLGTRLLPR